MDFRGRWPREKSCICVWFFHHGLGLVPDAFQPILFKTQRRKCRCKKPVCSSDGVAARDESIVCSGWSSNSRHDDSRCGRHWEAWLTSRLSGFMGAACGVGAVFGVAVLLHLPLMFTSKLLPFWISAGVLVATGFLCIFALNYTPKPAGPNSDNPEQQQRNRRQSFIDFLREAWEAIKKQPMLLVAFMGSFVARSNSLVSTAFLTTWILDTLRKNANISNPAMLDEEVLMKMAQGRARTLLTVSRLCSLVGAPLVGLLGDHIQKKRRPTTKTTDKEKNAQIETCVNDAYSHPMGPAFVLLLGAVLGACLYANFPSDPLDGNKPLLYTLFSLTGLSDIMTIVGSSALLATLAPAGNRGALSGCFAVSGAIGIMLTGLLGGIVLDAFGGPAAFLLVALENALLFVVYACIWLTSRP